VYVCKGITPAAFRFEESVMKVLHRRCAGLDVHQKEIVACRRIVKGRKVEVEVRRFATTTPGLLELADWLEEGGITHVAMEATGVYWKPVWHILEGRFTLVLANAAHIKGVPGRKSDVNDATWIAELLAHGLIRSSFVPPQPIQELRDLTRTRKQLGREIVRHTQRIQAVLEEANIKLTSVIASVLGLSGRRILKAIVAGETDAAKLAGLGSPRLAAPREVLAAALTGRVRDHHRFLIDQHLKTIEQLEATIKEFDARIEAALAPFRDAFERLIEMPGFSRTSVEIVIAEIGVDMTQFPSAEHLISWAGLCPRLDESAGRRRSTRVRKGAPWLKPVLVQSALAAGRTKGSSFQARYLSLKGRIGPKKAAVAVAAALLRVVYHMLKDGTFYQDLGPDYRRPRRPERAAANLARRIRAMGYEVDIRPAAAA
jgi:transposase